MANERLTEEELLFCALFEEFGNAREAAAHSAPGNPAAVRAYHLLKNRRVAKRLGHTERSREQYLQAVCTGLRRLAFGTANDAVRLAVCGNTLSGEDIARMDLYNLSELKFGEKGVELKFFDRQKALELLYEIASAAEPEQKESSFYQALEQGAAVLREEMGCADEV